MFLGDIASFDSNQENSPETHGSWAQVHPTLVGTRHGKSERVHMRGGPKEQGPGPPAGQLNHGMLETLGWSF